MKNVVCVEFEGGETERIHKSKFDRGCLYGGAVMEALPTLDEVASRGGVSPLSRFLAKDNDKTWHPAADGFHTAAYLLEQMRSQAEREGENDRLKNVIWDLSVITTLLQGGADEKASFRLAVSS